MTSSDALSGRLAIRSAECPDAVAVIDANGRAITRQALLERVGIVARGLRAAGLQAGDHVLFAVRPSADAIAWALGVSDVGGVLVAVDAGMGDELFGARMKMLAPKWVIAESLLLALSASRLAARLVRWRGGHVPPLSSVRGARVVRVGPLLPGTGGALSIGALMRLGQRTGTERPLTPLDPEGAAFIVFTSGTTGAPKAVVHSRRSLRAILDIVSAQLSIGERDVLYARDLHLSLPALFAGATVVIPPHTAFSPSRALRDLSKYRVTHMFAVTAECQLLYDRVASEGGELSSSLRLVLTGAAPVHAAFLKRFRAVLPARATLLSAYGMTEILPVAYVTLDDKVAFAEAGDLVGACVPGVHARVSAEGELLLRGPNLFTGYFGEANVVEHATGDMARIDGGRIVLLGRKKDMIIRGNFNIYPELYEATIERVSGVRRCAMVGVYDEAMADERIVLAVEAEPGVDAEGLVRTLRHDLRVGPARIDAAAQPDTIVVMPLPVSGRSHKVDKGALREAARARLTCA